MARNPIVSLAVAYHAFHVASAEGNEASRIMWQDLLVQAADKLAVQDSEMEGLKDYRDEVKSRDEEFLARFNARFAVDTLSTVR